MAWYDYVHWRNTIRDNYTTNTPHSMLHAITKHILSKSVEQHNIEGEAYVSSKQHFMIQALSRFISQNSMADIRLYKYVRAIVETLGDTTSFDTDIATNMPYWYANAIATGEVSTQDQNIFEYTSYTLRNDVIQDFGDVLPINKQIVLKHSHINDVNTFKNILNTEDVIDLFNSISRGNMSNIDHTFLQEMISKSGLKNITEFLYAVEKPHRIFFCSIPILDIYEYSPEFWKKNPPNLIDIIRNPLIIPEELYTWASILNIRISDKLLSEILRYNQKIVIDLIRSGYVLPNDHRIRLTVSRSQYISIEDVLSIDTFQWDWEELSRNPVIATPIHIKKYPMLPWVWNQWGIMMSQTITADFIEEHIEQFEGGLQKLSSNPGITPEFIDSHPEIQWKYGYDGLSSNKSITVPFLHKTIEKPWNLVTIVTFTKLCRTKAVHAIQSWWRICRSKRRNQRLARDVVEWYYHPDCYPAMKMRMNRFEEGVRCILSR